MAHYSPSESLNYITNVQGTGTSTELGQGIFEMLLPPPLDFQLCNSTQSEILLFRSNLERYSFRSKLFPEDQRGRR